MNLDKKISSLLNKVKAQHEQNAREFGVDLGDVPKPVKDYKLSQHTEDESSQLEESSRTMKEQPQNPKKHNDQKQDRRRVIDRELEDLMFSADMTQDFESKNVDESRI